MELERFDDRNQHFHGWAPKGVRKFSIAPKQPISRWGECRSTRPIPRSALHSDVVALLAVQRHVEALELRPFADAPAAAPQPGALEQPKTADTQPTPCRHHPNPPTPTPHHQPT